MDKLKDSNKDEAIMLLKRPLKPSPNLGLLYKHLGDVYYELNDLKNAIAQWEKYVHIEKSDSHKVFPKIESAFDLGEFDESEKFYDRIIKQDPNNQLAAMNRKSSLSKKANSEKMLNQLLMMLF